jgi:hypothetical protein
VHRKLQTRFLPSLACLVISGLSSLTAQVTPGGLSGASATQFVQQVVYNELDGTKNDHLRFTYRTRKETPKGSTTKQIIETSEGSVARLMAVNDQAPNGDQRKQDDDRIQKLINDPEERQRKHREQQEDARKAEGMLRVLPEAFLYEEIGREGDLIRFHFHPNPHFDPPNREASVYRGMEGTLIVDGRQKRLVKIDGHLFQDVTFGWGILGRLEKGGTFFVQQRQIDGPRWEVVTMDINMNGKALFFKTISMHEKEVSSDFHRVPENLSFKQAVDILAKGPSQIAENKPARPTSSK